MLGIMPKALHLLLRTQLYCRNLGLKPSTLRLGSIDKDTTSNLDPGVT